MELMELILYKYYSNKILQETSVDNDTREYNENKAKFLIQKH